MRDEGRGPEGLNFELTVLYSICSIDFSTSTISAVSTEFYIQPNPTQALIHVSTCRNAIVRCKETTEAE